MTATHRGFAWIAVATFVLAALRLTIDRPLGGGLSLGWPDDAIIGLRLTAIVAATVVGAALGVAGTMLQALLRNPLADPFVLGVSGGAGLGVMVAMYIGWAAGGAISTGAFAWLLGGERMLVPAALGAVAALALVQWLGQRRGVPDPLALVLAGAIVSSMCGACIMLLQHLVPHGLRGDLMVWMMGRIPEAVDGRILGAVAALVFAGVVLCVVLGRAMDAATFGDDEAHALGVSLPRLRWTLALGGGVLAAASVGIAGPLAFVGLVAPHAVRRLLGPRHAPLAVASALAGAALMLAADCLRQVVDFGGGRVPVGVFTALAGGPVFLALMRSGRNDA